MCRLTPASILLPVLLLTLITSTCILSFLLFLFLAHRLYLHLTIAAKTDSGEVKVEHLTQGVKNWADETKGRVDLGLKGRVRWADLGGAETGKWVVEDVKKENGYIDAPNGKAQ